MESRTKERCILTEKLELTEQKKTMTNSNKHSHCLVIVIGTKTEETNKLGRYFYGFTALNFTPTDTEKEE